MNSPFFLMYNWRKSENKGRKGDIDEKNRCGSYYRSLCGLPHEGR
jgi:hypothetical protein